MKFPRLKLNLDQISIIPIMWKFGLKNKKCLTKLIIECDVRVVMFFDWYVWM